MNIDKTTLSQIISERMPPLELDLDGFSPAEWDCAVQMAQAEGVGPLLYWRLSRAGIISSLPRQAQHKLRAMYFSTKINNEEIIQELERLMRRFDGAEIPVVALKGVCFALTIYPDLGLRPMADADLLVPASRLADAVRIAKGMGYDEPKPEAFPGLNDLLLHSVDLQKRATPFLALELHYSLVAEKSFAYAAPVDWFWSQTEPLQSSAPMLGLKNLLMLTPTAQVLYASAHAMLKHGARNASLRWFYDIDCLLRFHAERMDWDLLLSQAYKFEWGSAVSTAFSQIIDLFDTPIPSHVKNNLSGQDDRNVELIATYQEPPATHTLEEYQKLKYLNWRGRIRQLLALVLPGPAYMRWRYGLRTSWAMPAYYLYRWWGILKDAIHTIVLLIQESHLGSRVDK